MEREREREHAKADGIQREKDRQRESDREREREMEGLRRPSLAQRSNLFREGMCIFFIFPAGVYVRLCLCQLIITKSVARAAIGSILGRRSLAKRHNYME